MINYRQLILNLRGAGNLSAKQIERKTGVKQAKIYRITGGGSFKVLDIEMLQLLDLHFDYCPHLHNRSLFA